MLTKTMVIASALALSLLAAPAFADNISFQITVDTSSESGNSGFLEFQLNSGTLPAQAVNADISNFMGGTLDPANPSDFSSTGAFPLPGDLSLTATSSTDYFEAITFGNQLSFDVTLSGPGISLAGDATSSSGTSFLLDFLDPTQSNFLFANSVVGSIDVAPAGAVSVTTNPFPDSGSSVETVTPLTPVPEPQANLLLLAVAGAILRRARLQSR
jgi:hypothetical protein